jgi:hypothetical protein
LSRLKGFVLEGQSEKEFKKIFEQNVKDITNNFDTESINDDEEQEGEMEIPEKEIIGESENSEQPTEEQNNL